MSPSLQNDSSATGKCPVSGAGLGLRRGLMDTLMANPPADVDFMEIAPENWIRVGGKPARKLRFFTERYPFLIHGLSLSIGSPAPLDEALLADVKAFMDEHGVLSYSEHLSYCSDDGHLYDLMPIPFTDEAVAYVAARLRRAQDILERRIAIENVSYYAATESAMNEVDFTNAVLEEADCDLLLDINNLVVNSINHRYDAREFLEAMPRERVRYFHVAGHHVEAEDLRVDTHASAVGDAAWALLADAYARFGPLPTLLERDFNFPPVEELLDEVRRIRALQRRSRGGATAGALADG
ncbi:MAG TPA: DUF692 domain-containing protein [Woeseiaceae bacterium]|nr:DUF692 domain-containing protein [Woeseiaceae bacterium]